MLKRLDSAFQIDKWEPTPEGYLRVNAVIGKVGVNTYRQGNGKTVSEYRPPEVVLSEESVNSFVGKVITREHPGFPYQQGQIVTSQNSKDHALGHVLEARADHDAGVVRAVLQIEDQDLARDVLSGALRQLSPGYLMKVDKTPGTAPDGTPYQRKQTVVIGNHVALTKKGVQGPDVCVRLDSEDAVQCDLETFGAQAPALETKHMLLDGFTLELGDKDAQIVQKAVGDRDAKLGDLQSRCDSASADLAAAHAEIEKLKAEKAELAEAASEDALRVRLDSRLSLEREALGVLGDDDDKVKAVREMNDDDVKKAVVVSRFPGLEARLDSCEAAYLEGMYAAALSAKPEAAKDDAAKPGVDGKDLWKKLGGNTEVRADSAQSNTDRLSKSYEQIMQARYSGEFLKGAQ